MDVYSIGFTQKSAETFFDAIKRAGIKQLIDVRLNNSSQLAAYSKRDDLAYFLRVICAASYRHELLLAPTQAMLDTYRKQKGGWAEYERQFLALLAERHIETHFSPDLFQPTSVLLCSEATAEHCHRRLVLEYLQDHWGNLHIVHL